MRPINISTGNSPCTSLKTVLYMKTWNFTSLYFSQCLQEKTVIADLKASILFITALRAISIFSTLNFSC